MLELESFIRDVPDFPKKGILFKDLTTLWKDPIAFKESVKQAAKLICDMKIDKIVGAEARGFIVGSPLAYELNVGFIPVRKKGKLPADTISEEYLLEYGTDILEIHKDAIVKGERILIADDLIATGGTCIAISKMIERLGGEVAGFFFIIELEFLKGREKLSNYDVRSLLKF